MPLAKRYVDLANAVVIWITWESLAAPDCDLSHNFAALTSIGHADASSALNCH
jgi:hypothetical protein